MKQSLFRFVIMVLSLVSEIQSQDVVEIPVNTVTFQLLKPEGIARLGFSGVTCKPNPEIIISVEEKFGLFTVGDSINFNGFKGKLVSFNGCSSDTLKIKIEYNKNIQLGSPDTTTFDLLQDGNAHHFENSWILLDSISGNVGYFTYAEIKEPNSGSEYTDVVDTAIIRNGCIEYLTFHAGPLSCVETHSFSTRIALPFFIDTDLSSISDSLRKTNSCIIGGNFKTSGTRIRDMLNIHYSYRTMLKNEGWGCTLYLNENHFVQTSIKLVEGDNLTVDKGTLHLNLRFLRKPNYGWCFGTFKTVDKTSNTMKSKTLKNNTHLEYGSSYSCNINRQVIKKSQNAGNIILLKNNKKISKAINLR